MEFRLVPDVQKDALFYRLGVNAAGELAKENSPEFFTRFNEVYPEFRNKLLEISPRSKTSELTFCAYLFLNFSTKDIAEFTFTSPRTVQTRKYNIRKKFNIPTDEDLYIWIQNIARK